MEEAAALELSRVEAFPATGVIGGASKKVPHVASWSTAIGSSSNSWRLQESAPRESRDHGEVTMESFVKHHMMVILQPFLDHIQVVDVQIAQLSERMHQSDSKVVGNQKLIDSLKADLLDLRTDMKKTNAEVSSVHEGLSECRRRDDLIQQGMEHANGFVQRLHDQLQETDRIVPELQRTLGELECEHQAMRTHVQRTGDSIAKGGDLRRELDALGNKFKELKNGHDGAVADIEDLRKGVEHRAKLLLETRQVLDKSRNHAAGLQKGLEDLGNKEAQLSQKLEGWKSQWSKLHPALEALRKDAACLKQGYEHHDSALFNLQQGYATTFKGVEALQAGHDKLGTDVKAIRQSVLGLETDLGNTNKDVTQATALANGAHSGLQHMDTELHKACLKLDGLDSKHLVFSESLGKTDASLGEMAREQRKADTRVQVLQHEMEKAHALLQATRGDLEGTEGHLRSLRDDLGHTNETVQSLERGLDFCRSGFVGLQRGIVETGSHVSSRPLTLPKLPPGASSMHQPSPRVAKDAAAAAAGHRSGAGGGGANIGNLAATMLPGAEGVISSMFGQAPCGTEPPSEPSTQLGSRQSSRRCSLASAGSCASAGEGVSKPEVEE